MKLSVIIPSLDGKVPAIPDDPQLEVVIVKGVCPVSAARNEGLRRATGEYVAWVDADDEVTPDWLPEIQKALKSNPDIVSFDAQVEWHDGSGRPSYRLDGRAFGQLWHTVFRRSLFDGLRFEGTVHEDWRIQCQMPKDLVRVHLDRVLYRYRRTKTGLSQHCDFWGEFKSLWGLVRICNSLQMFRGICERLVDLSKTPIRRLVGR